MNSIAKLKQDLDKHIDVSKLEKLPKFFQAFEGGYGDGDLFMGVTVPNMRLVCIDHWDSINDEELSKLLIDPIHEVRLTAVFILVQKFNKSKGERKGHYANFYLNNLDGINNWDLVDSSAYKILGKWLLDKDRTVLYELADSNDLWKERISIIATKEFISKRDFKDTFKLADKFLDHPHDLMHKAVGWMLKEIGKLDQDAEEEYLRPRYHKMSRTTLRYAIEKFEEPLRKSYLEGRV